MLALRNALSNGDHGQDEAKKGNQKGDGGESVLQVDAADRGEPYGNESQPECRDSSSPANDLLQTWPLGSMKAPA